MKGTGAQHQGALAARKEWQLRERGITDERVLAAFAAVPREDFVPEDMRAQACDDTALPIGYGQTISQPYIVAFMTQALRLRASDRVLEIGTGSGYQAAILSRLAATVYTMEIIPFLAAAARRRLGSYENVYVRTADGDAGWPEAAPFQGILVACAPLHIPPVLREQLAEGGRLVIPLGDEGAVQELAVFRKENGLLHKEDVMAVRFVPMTGRTARG